MCVARSPLRQSLSKRLNLRQVVRYISSVKDSHTSFRSFVETLHEDGDLVVIDRKVDPNLEVGAITRRVYETRGKAPLFTNLLGAKDGLFRILGAPGGLRKDKSQQFGRIARHLGIPPTSSMRDVIDKVLSAKDAAPIPPIQVPNGPCKENKIFGDQIDLTKLPAPTLHSADGGKYIQTYGMHVVQSIDGSWTNWAIARAMVHDKRRLCGLVIAPQHIWQIHQQWKEQGKDVPWTLTLGVPPAAIITASMPLPDDVSEGEYLGSMTGSPAELVKCETNDLLVPANSEIVFEGTLSVTEKGPEGPFGEMHGYTFVGDVRQQPLFTVNAITHRNNAILPISVTGTPVDETHTLIGTLTAAEMLHHCRVHSLPVKDVFLPFESNCIWAALQIDSALLPSLHTNPKDFCMHIARTFFSARPATIVQRLFIVGDDIDVYDFQQVLWAYTPRCRPGMDEWVIEDVRGFPLVPYMSHGPGNPVQGGKCVSSCLLPVEYERGRNWQKADFEHAYPKQVKEMVVREWERMGF